MSRHFALVVLVVLVSAAPAWGLRATGHLDALEATLAGRAAALAGAADKVGKKQLRAAEKALARIAVDTLSLSEDLKLAKKIAGPVAKAFADDAEVMDLLTAAADAFEAAVADDAAVLERAREPLPEAKLTKKADRLLGKAEKLREKARAQAKPKKRLSLLYKAQRSADKAADVLVDALGDPAPTRLIVSPESALLTAPGETLALRAIVLDQLERPMQATVVFASTNPGVASVTGAGVVSGGAVGSAQIVASVAGLETAITIVNARTVPGAVLVDDAQVASLPEPLDEDAPYGVGFLYTVELFGAPPQVGDLLVGTGQIPLGGLVVDVVGADPALVTLEIRPLDELFTDLVIDERIDSGPENLEVPAEVLEHYDVEAGEDGAYVFVPREDVDPDLGSEPRRRPRGAVEGTVAEVGPFSCESSVSFNLGLNAAPTFSVVPGVTLDFQYSTGAGLQRLVATGGATLTASYKPRLQSALTGKVGCKLKVLEMQISVPGPIALVVGGQIPIGLGFELSGTVTVLQMGFDATWSDSFSVEVGIDCTSGSCEPVAGAPDPPPPATPPPPAFQWVFPTNLASDFNVALSLSVFGYFELRIGNPLWETLQLKMVEGQAGVEQAANFAPKLSQWLNETSASDYQLKLYAKVGSGASLNSILGFFNVNVASFEVKGELSLSNSPTAATLPSGSLTFEGEVAEGEEVEAKVTLKDVTYLGLQNVEAVRFYRRDGSDLVLRDVVTRQTDGQTEYVGRWTATEDDLGEQIGVFVTTLVPVLEFEIEKNSLRTLNGSDVPLVVCTRLLRAHVLPDGFSELVEDEEEGPCPFAPSTASVSVTAAGVTSHAVLDSDVQVDADGRLEGVEFSGSGSVSGAEVLRAEVNDNTLSVDFTIAEPTSYSLIATASASVTPNPPPINAEAWLRLRSLDFSTIFGCAVAGAGPVIPCPASEPQLDQSGVLPAGSYRLETWLVIRERGLAASFSGTLVLGD